MEEVITLTSIRISRLTSLTWGALIMAALPILVVSVLAACGEWPSIIPALARLLRFCTTWPYVALMLPCGAVCLAVVVSAVRRRTVLALALATAFSVSAACLCLYAVAAISMQR